VNRQKGLLAFLCAAIACTLAALQLPLASGVERLFGDSAPPLALHLKTDENTRLRNGPGGSAPVTVQSLRRDRRPDPEIAALSRTQRLPFAVLKAHLAVSSQGVRGAEGLFWARLPEGDADLPDDGLVRTRAAAALLGELQKETGSLRRALMAWKVGAYRARRAAADTTDPRLHMLAAHRQAARTHLCTVLGLAAALEADRPIGDREVHAPMPGRVLFAGTDGARGNCVVVLHACDLSTELCRLDSLAVEAGQRVPRGQRLGTAEPEKARFELRLGQLPVDPECIKPAGGEK
jgi:hypothetical protein